MNTGTAEQVETLNSLLRGEISAIETYQQALEKVKDGPGAAELRKLHADHRQAATLLKEHDRDAGDEPDHSSGAWGVFAKAVEGTAKVFGTTAALKALKEGEESGLADYEAALEDKDLPAECVSLIRDELLPQTRSHVQALDRLMARV